MSFAVPFHRVSIGLDIGSSSVKAVALRKRRAGWSLAASGDVPIEPPHGREASAPESAVIGAAIRRLLANIHVRRARIAAALTGQAVVIKRLRLPAMSASALADAIPWEAEPHIPFDVADAQLDYEVRGRGGQTWTGVQDVLLVAAKRDRIASRRAVVALAGQPLGVLDVEALALANAYQMNYPEHLEELTALVHVGKSTAVTCLLERGELVLTRDIPVGGRHHIAELVREVRKIIEAHGSAAAIDHVSRVMLSGGAYRADGLREMLEAELAVPVHVLDPFRKVSRSTASACHEASSPAYAVAVGLAMRRRGDR